MYPHTADKEVFRDAWPVGHHNFNFKLHVHGLIGFYRRPHAAVPAAGYAPLP